MYEKAIEADPHYAQAYAGLSLTYFLDWFLRWSSEPAQSMEQTLNVGQRAIALDDSLIITSASLCLKYSRPCFASRCPSPQSEQISPVKSDTF